MTRRPAIRILIAATLAAPVIAMHPPVRATLMGFTVNTRSDGPDADPGDGWCKTSTGACTLRAAVQEVNELRRPGNTISLPAGKYTLTLEGSGEDRAATGDLDIRADMTIIGQVGNTTIAGGTGLDDRILDVQAGGSPEFTLNGVDVKGGRPPGREDGGGIRVRGGSFKGVNVSVIGNSSEGSGGGLYQDAGTLDLAMVDFTGNSARTKGGGLGLEGSTTSTNFNHVRVSDNSAFEGGGFSAFLDADATGSIPLMFQVDIRGNSTTGGPGGGMAVSRITAIKTTVSGNSAPYGGGVELVGSSHPPSLASRIYVLGNSASVDGGGIYTTHCAPSCGSLVQVTVEDNVATRDGSGMYVNGGLSMRSVTINANRTRGEGTYGGAIYHAGFDPLLMTNVTIGENQSGPVAGGVVEDSSATDLFTNVTIANNAGGAANGVFVTPTATPPQLRNTIVSSQGRNCTRGLTSLGYNLDSGDSCGLSEPHDLVNTNPRLHPVGDNGGGTHTMKPGGLSPTADAGSPNICPTTDQRSVRRPVDYDANGSAVCDIGAYENGVSAVNSDIGWTYVTPSVAGLKLTYTMGLKSGGAGSGVNSIVTDVLPSSLTAPITCSADGGVCDVIGNTVKVKFAKIRVGQTPKITITALIATLGTIENTVVVWSENPDWFPYDNTKTVSITI
jgi:CSLREA domain-containing protein